MAKRAKSKSTIRRFFGAISAATLIVPLFRQLRDCRGKDYAEAAKETGITLFFSMLPFLLGALLIAPSFKGSIGKFSAEFFESGEALLVSAALIGPAIYIITRKYGELPNSLTIHFPQGWFFVLLSSAICLIAAAFFSLQRIYTQLAEAVPKPKAVQTEALFNPYHMQTLSLTIFAITVVLLYLIIVLKNYTESGAAYHMRSQTQEFLDDWKR